MLGFKKKKNTNETASSSEASTFAAADGGFDKTERFSAASETGKEDASTAKSVENSLKTSLNGDKNFAPKQSEIYIDEEAARILAEVAEYENTNNRYRDFSVKEAKPKRAAERVDEPALKLINQLHSALPVRLSASKEEKLGARMLRDFINKELGEPARMEPFDVRPLAGRQGLTAYAAIFASAFIAYVVFAPAAAVITGLLIAMLSAQVFHNGGVFDILFPKKTSYNVVAAVKGAKKEEGKTIILGASYDSACGSPADLKLPQKLKIGERTASVLDTAALVSVCALCLLSLLKTVLYYATPMYGYSSFGRALMFLLAALFTAFGASYMAVRNLPFKKYGKRNRESIASAAVAVGAAKYFSAHKKDLGDCRLTIVLLGSGSAGAKGSAAFAKRHFNDEEFENPLFIGLGNLLEGDYAVITGDGRVKYDEGLADRALDAFKAMGAEASRSENITDATAFAQKGIPAVEVTRVKRAAVKKIPAGSGADGGGKEEVKEQSESASALAENKAADIGDGRGAESALLIETQCRAVIELIKAVAKK